MNREDIYNALLDFLATLPSMSFNSVSRVWRPHTDFAAAQLPAMLVDENTETVMNPEFAMLGVETIAVDLWLYFHAPHVSQTPGREAIIPQRELNAALDDFTNGLAATQLGYPTLNGLVQWIRVEGQIRKIVGVGSGNLHFCIAKVPILMRYAGPA